MCCYFLIGQNQTVGIPFGKLNEKIAIAFTVSPTICFNIDLMPENSIVQDKRDEQKCQSTLSNEMILH